MKIFHLVNTLGRGGAEHHLLDLCRLQRDAGFEVEVGGLRNRIPNTPLLTSDFREAGVQVNTFEANARFDPTFLSDVRRWVNKQKPDLLHTHLPRADIAGWLSINPERSIPWVVTVHDVHSKSWSAKWMLPLMSFVWKRADKVIAISPAVYRWLIEERGLTEKFVETVPYGIDISEYVESAPEEPNKFAGSGSLRIGSLGRYEPRKGHPILIEAMRRVLETISDVNLVIGGHDIGSFGAKLDEFAGEVGVDSNVRLPGFIEDVPSFLQRSDVFALATRSEGFGRVFIEAMATGTPVVASDISPINEIVQHGVTGILARPDDTEAFADALITLLEDPELRERMGRAGRERVRDIYSLDRMFERTTTIYSELVRG